MTTRLNENVNYLDHWLSSRNSYQWLCFVATLDFNEEDFDLAGFASGEVIPTPEVDRVFEVFVHEYTHFLQHVTTLWGVWNACDYASVALLTGCGRARKDQGMLQRGQLLRGIIQQRFSAGGNRRIDTEVEDKASILKWGNVIAVVDTKAIRENMARCAAELYLGKGDEAIHETGKIFDGFHDRDGGVEWCSKAEYWVIFEYFYQAGFQRVGEGVLKLCTYLLNYECPETAFERFLHFISESSAGDLWENAEDWFRLASEKERRDDSLEKLEGRLRGIYVLGKKHGEEHDIVKEFGGFAGFLAGRLDPEGSVILDGISSVRFWAALVQKNGSPIIRFRNKSSVFGPMVKHQQALQNFCGMTEVLEKLGQEGFPCAFLDEFPICVTHKDESLCGRSPFRWIDKDNGCLFCNSMKALGMISSDEWKKPLW